MGLSKLGKTALRRVAIALALIAPPALAQNPPREDVRIVGERNQLNSRWLRGETPNFIVYASDGEANLRRDAINLERFDWLLRKLTGVDPDPVANRLIVYLVDQRAEIDALRREKLEPGFVATGYYSAAPSGTIAAADVHWDRVRPAKFKYRDVWLFTEYSRHFLLQQAHGAYVPAWYIDGLGLYLATAKFYDDRIEYGAFIPSMVDRWRSRPLPSSEALLTGRLDRGQDYSGISLLLVHYIFADPARVTAFGKFVKAVRGGAEPAQAFQTAFATTFKALDAALLRYRGNAFFARLTGVHYPEVQVDVATMPRSADRLLLDQAALRIGVPEKDRQREILGRTRDAVERGGDAFARRVAAHAHALYGDPRLAGPWLDSLLAARPDDAELLYLQGLRHLGTGRADPAVRVAEFDQARRWFARAHKLDADNYPALYLYAESLSTTPAFLSENTENVLRLAAQIAPQATQIHVTTAMMLMINGKFADAIAILSPIIVNPRDPASEQVPALLAQARSGQKPTMEQLLASFRFNATWHDLNCC